MTQDIMLLLCNAPDADCARRLAHALVTQRLAACAHTHHARLVLAAAPDATGQLRPQPTFALLHRSLAPSLADFLQQGGHKIGQWAQEQGRILCPFDQATDHPLRSFVNINTLAELQTLE